VVGAVSFFILKSNRNGGGVGGRAGVGVGGGMGRLSVGACEEEKDEEEEDDEEEEEDDEDDEEEAEEGNEEEEEEEEEEEDDAWGSLISVSVFSSFAPPASAKSRFQSCFSFLFILTSIASLSADI
jgi:hypothetical protein